jgi:hypothetical protein
MEAGVVRPTGPTGVVGEGSGVLEACGDAVATSPEAVAAGEAAGAAFCCPVLFETTESLLHATASEIAHNAVRSLIRDNFECEFMMTFYNPSECSDEL